MAMESVVTSWGKEDVASWLETRVGLTCGQAFREAAIDGAQLLDLRGDAPALAALGVVGASDRELLSRWLAVEVATAAAPAAPPGEAPPPPAPAPGSLPTPRVFGCGAAVGVGGAAAAGKAAVAGAVPAKRAPLPIPLTAPSALAPPSAPAAADDDCRAATAAAAAAWTPKGGAPKSPGGSGGSGVLGLGGASPAASAASTASPSASSTNDAAGGSAGGGTPLSSSGGGAALAAAAASFGGAASSSGLSSSLRRTNSPTAEAAAAFAAAAAASAAAVRSAGAGAAAPRQPQQPRQQWRRGDSTRSIGALLPTSAPSSPSRRSHSARGAARSGAGAGAGSPRRHGTAAAGGAGGGGSSGRGGSEERRLQRQRAQSCRGLRPSPRPRVGCCPVAFATAGPSATQEQNHGQSLLDHVPTVSCEPLPAANATQEEPPHSGGGGGDDDIQQRGLTSVSGSRTGLKEIPIRKASALQAAVVAGAGALAGGPPSSGASTRCTTSPRTPRPGFRQVGGPGAPAAAAVLAAQRPRSPGASSGVAVAGRGLAWSSFGRDVQRGADFGLTPRECLSPRRARPGPGPAKYNVSQGPAAAAACAPRFAQEPRSTRWLIDERCAAGPGPGKHHGAKPKNSAAGNLGAALSRTPRLGVTNSANQDVIRPDPTPGPYAYSPQYQCLSTFR